MNYTCWRCGAEGTLILPVSRREACRDCSAEIHVCRQCTHFDERRTPACREERAEPPREADRANFCDWYALNAQPRRQDGKSESAAGLNALFGDLGSADGTDEPSSLDDLFGKKD